MRVFVDGYRGTVHAPCSGMTCSRYAFAALILVATACGAAVNAESDSNDSGAAATGTGGAAGAVYGGSSGIGGVAGASGSSGTSAAAGNGGMSGIGGTAGMGATVVGGAGSVGADAACADEPTGTPSACDPFAPSPKPISLGTVVAAGKSVAGIIYVVDKVGYDNHVFVSNGGVLERQRIAGAGSGPTFYVFSIVDHSPPFTLQIEVGPSGPPTAMGVLEGPPPSDSKTIVIGQQGEKLTLLATADVASMPVRNLLGTQVLEYNARLDDGRAMVVVRPKDDWTYADFRVFFGQPPNLSERAVQNVSRGSDTWIVFDLDGAQATALFKSALSSPGDSTLKVGAVAMVITQLSITAPPAGFTYSCLAR
jgi:hypothetical protein